MDSRRRYSVALALLCLLVLAAPRALAEQVSMAMWAVQVTTEGRTEPFFDPGLEEVRETLGKTGDTFRKLKTARSSLQSGSESAQVIGEGYTLFVTYLGRENDGHIRLDIRVQRQPADPNAPPVNAMVTRLSMTPGKKVKLQGFKMSKGELAIVLSCEP